jgi:anti-sigma regulatory factor (Ser/Thr protein kinase)
MLTTHDRGDDVAVLVVRRASSSTPPTAEDLAATVRTQSFMPDPALAGAARRYVVQALREWGLDELADDAALSTTELVTNAILHSRGDFTVAVRRTSLGARVDVQDDRPDRLPVVVPDSLDPLDTGITGRGLILVAGVARRWGYFTTDIAKTVWFELSPERLDEPTAAIVELAERESTPDAFAVRLVDLPVRAAIASGVQVDELVREVQLDPARLTPADRELLHDLLDRSAGPRLIGRQAAFKAAADGSGRYTLRIAATPGEAAAVAELGPFLAQLATQGELDATAVGADVLAMREWVSSELAAQAAGAEPTPYPGHKLR